VYKWNLLVILFGIRISLLIRADLHLTVDSVYAMGPYVSLLDSRTPHCGQLGRKSATCKVIFIIVFKYRILPEDGLSKIGTCWNLQSILYQSLNLINF
jgi:hypothetical protein